MYKKILIYILLIISLLACERKPLYLIADNALKINVRIEANIDNLWNESWRDSLLYDWDENLYGPIGYTLPGTCNVVIFNRGSLIGEKTIQVAKRELIDVELNNTYDLLIYSKQYHWLNTYYEGGRYYIECPSTEYETKNEISNKYETVNQPGEVFSMNKKEIYLSDDISDFEEVIENGKLVYVYNIDEVLQPASYIYIIQFIVINDDNSPTIEAKDIANFTLSGISVKKNLFLNQPIYTGHKQISAFDIKPGQFYTRDTLVFASRVTILDLLPEDENSSWYSQINYLYYTNIDVNTYNYGEVTGTKDITQQLKENPKGGIINVVILNSELKAGNNHSSSFGIDLNEWQQHTFEIF